jgi:hypothetical protein
MLLEPYSPRHGIANDHSIALMGHLTCLYSSPACMETHAYLQSLGVSTPTCPLRSSQLPLQVQGGQHSALCMILLGHRGAKDQQDTIASDPAEHTSVPLCLRMRQLMQRMEPTLPGLEASLFILYARSNQGTI